MKFLFLFTAFAISIHASAKTTIDPIRLEIGKSYESYSKEDLRRRVWQLERAVEQLQAQVFQLAIRDNTAGSTIAIGGSNPWTCTMQSFGKTHVASGNTRASAVAQVLKKCSDATNAVHCKESEANCDNE